MSQTAICDHTRVCSNIGCVHHGKHEETIDCFPMPCPHACSERLETAKCISVEEYANDVS